MYLAPKRFRRLKSFGYLSHIITVTELMNKLITIRCAFHGTHSISYYQLFDCMILVDIPINCRNVRVSYTKDLNSIVLLCVCVYKFYA